jgi:hypothetical protein
MTKARAGYNAGGRCYGYSNVEVREGDRRARVEYAVHAEQAKVVRAIFERYAEGWGLKAIVKDLNAKKVPPPQAGKRGTGSWSPSAVHAMLRRERYKRHPSLGQVRERLQTRHKGSYGSSGKGVASRRRAAPGDHRTSERRCSATPSRRAPFCGPSSPPRSSSHQMAGATGSRAKCP